MNNFLATTVGNIHNTRGVYCVNVKDLNGDIFEVEMYFQYGLQSSPPIGTEMHCKRFGNIIYGAPNYPYSAIPLGANEVIIGNIADRVYVKFSANQIIIGADTSKEVVINASSVTINASTSTFNGDIKCNNIEATAQVKSATALIGGKDFGAHTHTSASPGSPTSPPL